ncbi:MAG: metallophosphatase [Bacteroidetes bacterium]|nr:metallophosphatase [Bacteroidota bacterium]
MEEFLIKNRRDFLKNSLYGSLGVAGMTMLPSDVFAKKEIVKIVILHTNDVHSHIDPFPSNDPKYPGLGGVARRAALVEEIRSKEPNVLLLDAGDIYQGTPYFNKFGGELELKLMSKMAYDAGTIGNHDFDNGIPGIVKQLPNASFPLLCANYDFSDTAMNGKTQAYKIFEKDGIKVGVFGIGIELDGLVDKRMYENTKYLDPLEKAAEMSVLLKQEKKCDIVVCLSHLGYSYENKKVSDVVLAKESKNIDLIIGGHTHTFLDKPVELGNRENKKVIVAQVGWAGIKLGKITYFVERSSKKKHVEGTSLNLHHLSNSI